MTCIKFFSSKYSNVEFVPLIVIQRVFSTHFWDNSIHWIDVPAPRAHTQLDGIQRKLIFLICESSLWKILYIAEILSLLPPPPLPSLRHQHYCAVSILEMLCRRRRCCCQTHYNIIIYTDGLFQFAICCDKCELVETISDCECVWCMVSCATPTTKTITTTTNRFDCHSVCNAQIVLFSLLFLSLPSSLSFTRSCNALPPIIHSELYSGSLFISVHFFLCFVLLLLLLVVVCCCCCCY